jgi:hypothetical protein
MQRLFSSLFSMVDYHSVGVGAILPLLFTVSRLKLVNYRQWHLPSPFLLTFRLTGMKHHFFCFESIFFLKTKMKILSGKATSNRWGASVYG